MAIDKVRTRSRSTRHGAERGRARRTAVSAGVDTSVVPRVVAGALNGVEIVVVGALRITRDVLVRAISGGAEAVTATAAGVRGVVSAASRMIGNMASAMQGSASRAGITRARRGRPRGPRAAPRSTRNSLAA